jgi:hypothetical protein
MLGGELAADEGKQEPLWGIEPQTYAYRPTRLGGRTAVQSQPRSRARRAAAVRLGAPSLRMASDR